MPSNDNIVITGGNLIVDTVTNIARAASFPLPRRISNRSASAKARLIG